MYKVIVLLTIFKFGECVITEIPNDHQDKNLQVSTSNGILQGRKAVSINGVPYWAYQGIPYAAPPVGNMRFRAPVPNASWKGVLDATMERSGCVETYPDGINVFLVRGEEDCLYVNVYTRQNPIATTKYLPVLVWIYGGAFLFGNSSSKVYGIDKLIEQDIVVVTFNYRVGMFGFLSTEDLASPGNYGLKDQSLVLKWVQQNINAFGGDKNLVTIFGQSAGSVSVFYHMISPSSKGLFHRAIAGSGSPLCMWAYTKNARDIAFDVALAAGIKTKNTKDIVNQLRKMDIEKLKKISKLVTLVNIPQTDKTGIAFGPTIEAPHTESFFTQAAFEAFKSGSFNRVPLIMGLTSLETAIFSDLESIIRPMLLRYDLSPSSLPSPNMNIDTFNEKSEAGNKIKEHYFNGAVFDASSEEILQYTTDDQFLRPITKTAQLMWKFSPIYFYIFSYSSNYGIEATRDIVQNRPNIRGVAHWEDLWYIWQQQNPVVPTQMDRVVITRILKLWRNFMEYGNPTPTHEDLLQNITWPTVSSSSVIDQLIIDSDLKLTQNYRWSHVSFWENIYEEYGHEPYLTY